MKKRRFVSVGLLLAALGNSFAATPTPKHQYTFNDGFGSLIVKDTVSGADGILIHNTGNARLEDGQWKTGNDNSQEVQRENGDYVDLPNGIISALGEKATFEFWVTWRGGNNWTHMYDFGISDSLIEDIPTQGTATSWIMMSPAAAGGNAMSRTVKDGSSSAGGLIDAVAVGPIPSDGSETHIAVVIDETTPFTDADGNASPGSNHFYVNGALVASAGVVLKMAELNDVNNWFGQSSWGGDRIFNGDFNEARIYDTALTAQEVLANFSAGPVPSTGNNPIQIPGGPSYLDPTKTKIAQRVSQAPVIDGEIDDADWAPRSDNNWVITQDPGIIAGIPGQAPFDVIRGGRLHGAALDTEEATGFNDDLNLTDIRIGHDDDNLYIAVAVQDFENSGDSAAQGSEDGQTWQDDSVEIFIDGNNSNFPNRSTSGEADVVGTGGQFVIARNNAYRDKESGDPGFGPNGLWYASASENTDGDGYVVEFRIALSVLGNPKPGDNIGFNISVNDDDDDGESDSTLIWTGNVHSEYSYGNLVLGGKSYTSPKAATPTIDGALNADEYPGAREIVINRHTGIYNIGVGDDKWPPGDMHASAWVTHDDEAVYVALNITDDIIVTNSAEAGSEDGSTWTDDSVEIFFDADNSNGPGAGNADGRGDKGFEGQYVLTANGAWRDNEANNPTFGENNDWFGATQVTSTGYQAEFKIKKSALSNPADGAIMGFSISLNDDDGADRKNQLSWSGVAHQESSYGDLILSADAGGPVGGGDPGNLGITLNDNGTATVTWTGGTLQWSTDISSAANWQPVPGASGGSYDVNLNAQNALYFRSSE